MPSKIACGYNFTPNTVDRIKQLAKFHEINFTALLERLVREEYERQIQRNQFTPEVECSQVREGISL